MERRGIASYLNLAAGVEVNSFIYWGVVGLTTVAPSLLMFKYFLRSKNLIDQMKVEHKQEPYLSSVRRVLLSPTLGSKDFLRRK